jgi:hypothetical protein
MHGAGFIALGKIRKVASMRIKSGSARGILVTMTIGIDVFHLLHRPLAHPTIAGRVQVVFATLLPAGATAG